MGRPKGCVEVGGVRHTTSAAGSTLDLYDSFRWFYKALQAYAMFAYTLAPGLFAHGAVLTDARDQRPFLIPAIGSLGLGLFSRATRLWHGTRVLSNSN